MQASPGYRSTNPSLAAATRMRRDRHPSGADVNTWKYGGPCSAALINQFYLKFLRSSMVAAVSRALSELSEPCLGWTREPRRQPKSLGARRQYSQATANNVLPVMTGSPAFLTRPPPVYIVGHYGDRSLRKVLTSLHHIASTDNFQIHTTERLQYNTRGTRKRTPYTQNPFQNMLRHPRGGYSPYDGHCNICSKFDPLSGLWKIGIVWPLYVRKNMEMSNFDPHSFVKIWRNV